MIYGWSGLVTVAACQFEARCVREMPTVERVPRRRAAVCTYSIDRLTTTPGGPLILIKVTFESNLLTGFSRRARKKNVHALQGLIPKNISS